MDSFQYITHAQEVIFGVGSLARLPEAIKSLGWQRIMLCTSPSLRANGRLDSLREILKDRLIAVFDSVQPHVQDWQLAEALSIAREHCVDAVIGMGGGSPIGMAKAVVFSLAEPGSVPVAVIAIPSTYAGSEMTSIFGITHTAESPSRKVTVQDPNIAPRLVIYDPELTLDLSPQMTASSGMNALAHCIEALYSITRHPLSTAAAASGVRFIYHALPRCYARGGDIHVRSDLFLGAHMAAQSLTGIKLGLHHGLCHVLGGTAGIPHGIANAIILPHAMRFNASATTPQLLPAVEAMDIPISPQGPAAAVETAAQRLFDLVGYMSLPQRLRDVGVKESDLTQLAYLAYENRTVQNNPRPIKKLSQIKDLLQAAW